MSTSLVAGSCPEQGILRLSGSRAIFYSRHSRQGHFFSSTQWELQWCKVSRTRRGCCCACPRGSNWHVSSDRQKNINNEGEHDNGRRKLHVVSNMAATTATLLPIWNDVLVVSYKSLMMLGNTCAKMLLNTLGINLDYVAFTMVIPST